MNDDSVLSRRAILRSLGLGLAAVPFARVIGCAKPGDMQAVDAGTAIDATMAADVGAVDAASLAWATGGTAAMTGTYPDPFAGGLGATCNLTCSATLGPCYAQTFDRTDISEGVNGLPVRFAFLIVNESCEPVEGAEVDIWHTAPSGVYSGAETSATCHMNDAAAVASHFFRGYQTTGADGRADFNSCFPGWYSGRTIHIHFTVRIGATAYVTSQLYFLDSLDDEIIATQPFYNDRGTRNVTNLTDGVVAGADLSDHTFQTARMDDGAMMAWKAIVIRSSTGTPLCTT